MENNNQKLKYDSIESAKAKLEIVRKGNKSQKLHDIEYRIKQLKLLKAALIKYEQEAHDSNKIDLGQSQFMSFYGSYSIAKVDVDDIIKNIRSWAAPRSVDTPVIFAPGKSYVVPEPYGVCLAMGAWNFQYVTLIMPVAQAIAAGNCVIAKPSEMAEASAIICEKIFSELDPEIIQTVQGGAEICIELLKNKFDVIVFTGSPEKGRLVALAAAEHLTPCILELGGQNPAVVDESADLTNAAYNLVNGRFINCGQVCLSPEYVLVDKKNHIKFLDELKKTVETFYNKNSKESQDYSRIINDFHTERLIKLVENPGGKIIIGGDHNLKERFVAPTVINFESTEELAKSNVFKGEIFGPIISVAPFNNIDDCANFINERDKPLAMYFFGKNGTNKDKLLKKTSSGAFITNDAVVHIFNNNLPFGGVGKSGYAAYHGKWGYDAFSHIKPVFERPQLLMKLRYPPFTNDKKRILTFLMNYAHFSQYDLIKGIFFLTILATAWCMRNYVYSFKK